jgi:hypothetical protein
MVLPGADRESDDNFPDDSQANNSSARRNPFINIQTKDQKPMTPEQQHMARLATPDLSSLDLDALTAKSRSLWKYINPSYSRWVGLTLSMRIATAQVGIDRELTKQETNDFADALVAAHANGVLYNRFIMWPAMVFIIAYGRRRKLVSAPTMGGKFVGLFSIRRPYNQFFIAWFGASMLEGYGYRSMYSEKMHTPPLRQLNDDLQAALAGKYGRPGQKVEGSSEEMRQRYKQQQEARNRAMGALAQKTAAEKTAAILNVPTQEVEESLWGKDEASPTGGSSFVNDDWNNPSSSASSTPSAVDDYLSPTNEPDPYDDDASPTAPAPPPRDAGPQVGAWDRLRQRSEAQPRGSTDDTSVWQRQRNRGATDKSSGRRYDGASRGSDEVAERGSSDGGDAWDRRRNVGASRESLSDSFSFSETDEERELAKAEAQAEFDKRVERERHGKNFEAPSSGGKTW